MSGVDMAQPNNTLVDLSDALAGAVAGAASAIVAVHAGYRSSGVIWRDGVVVAAAHTIRREQDIEIALADGRGAAATLAGLDSGTDLAVLRAQAVQLPLLERSDMGALKVGQLAIAVARVDERGVNASLGMIGGLGSAWRTSRGGRLEQLIRLAITLYPGFSGGALLDTQGRVVGIATAGLAHSGGIAIPHSTVDRVADDLLNKGYVSRSYLGVALQSVRLPEPLRSKLKVENDAGVIVVDLESGGPAERAGVLIGDIFLNVNGRTVRDTTDVLHALGVELVEPVVPATIIRGGESLTLNVTPGERPQRSR
jgi:S1-C subfamily serine protease